MHIVGKIDREIYKCITKDIVTDEVIITDERIQHIKERHPKDYEEVIINMSETLKHPEYILQDVRPDTGLVIKSIENSDENVQTVLRIHTSKDEKGYKNSVISCWKISSKRLQNYLRNNSFDA